MKTTFTAFVLLIQTLQCLASDDSPFQLTSGASGICLVKTKNQCNDIRWTTGDRLLVQQMNKCLGVQGKSVGSEISLYDCDENSELQKWECQNETVLTLKDSELYIELTADNTAVLSRTIGPNNHLTILGTSSGACRRTYREIYTIGGNAAGRPCMFPFQHKDQWYSDCTTYDSLEKKLWCSVDTKFQNEHWGYCPVTSREGWNRHPTTGAYYQLNMQSALTWPQAETSCKQQGATLLSITDPHQHAYVIALLGSGGSKFWTGLVLDPKHGWIWSNGKPYRYMKWDSGYPSPTPGHNCVIGDPAVQYFWQNSPCSKKIGYICYSEAAEELPTQAETGYCSSPWIPYNGHCFYLNRTQKTWSEAQRECRNLGGDLVSIRNVEDQSFVISQLGYASTDELWIGLNDRKTEGLFEWSDHSTVSFTSWEYGKPAVSSEIKDCVLIMGENGNWADRVCEEKHGSVCMKMSTSELIGEEVLQDVGCKTGWRRHGSYCYFIGEETKTFYEARDDCRNSNSYLADVLNGVDNSFLVSLVGMRPEKHFWLGLLYKQDIDEFVWTNNHTVRFTHWNALMPGQLQGCVAMTTGIFAGLWDVLSCTSKAKYICKHQAEGASLTTIAPTVRPSNCASGWTLSQSKKHCLKLYYYFKRTWYEARDHCRAIGGDLVSIHSADDQQHLPVRYETTWIGLSAPDPVKGYVWSDGSPLQFQHWKDGEPNNKNNVESCAEINGFQKRSNEGSWNDAHCEKYNSWICQIPRGMTPKPVPVGATPDYSIINRGWLLWKGNQYFFGRSAMSIEESRHFCQQMHSDLVTINSEAESVFLWKKELDITNILQIMSPTSSERRGTLYWIGLTVDLDGTYGWMDGSPVVFQRWDQNQPRFLNNDETCAVMTSDMGFWHNYNCGFEHHAICKRSSSPLLNATVAPKVTPQGGCPQTWKKMKSRCFKVIGNKNETWDGARMQCKAMGGNLASILTRHEHVFLINAMAEAPTTDMWIGLSSVNGSQFYWTDGKKKKYTTFVAYDRHPWRHRYSSDDRYEKVCVVMTDPHSRLENWRTTPCNVTNGYICSRTVDPSFPDTNETTFTNYVKIFNDSIKAVIQPMSWDAAKRNCEGDGAQLASLRNQWSQFYSELIALNLNAPVWIGLNKLETGGYFRYIDGWRPLKPKWDSGEPHMLQPCVYVTPNGKWRTADCSDKRPSICMKSTDVPPTEPSDFPGFCPSYINAETHRMEYYSWLPFRGYCYLFLTERVDWPRASANCLRHGGTLASIEDPSEQVFIQDNISVYQDSHSSFWIGLYQTHMGMIRWLDKVPVDYTNWRLGYPNGNGVGTIKVEDGLWTTEWGSLQKPYICKTPKILRKAIPTTVNPKVESPTHGHVTLPVVLVITAVAIGAVLIFFIVKKFGCRVAHQEMSRTFDNPLLFKNEPPHAQLVENQ